MTIYTQPCPLWADPERGPNYNSLPITEEQAQRIHSGSNGMHDVLNELREGNSLVTAAAIVRQESELHRCIGGGC